MPAAKQWLNTVDPRLQVPSTLQVSGGVAHELPNGLTLSADFVHAPGSGLEYVDVNNRPTPVGSVETLDPRFSGIFELQRVGFTHYTALQARAQYQRKSLNVAASYTLSRATSTLVSGTIDGSGPRNPFDLGEDLGPDDTDVRHNLVVNGSYLFPLEIQVAGIFTYRSALPWSVTTTENPTGAYYPPRIEPKNSRRGDSQCTLDVRLGKVFRLGSRVRASISWEMLNALNTLNYTAYDTLHESPPFGFPVAAPTCGGSNSGSRWISSWTCPVSPSIWTVALTFPC